MYVDTRNTAKRLEGDTVCHRLLVIIRYKILNLYKVAQLCINCLNVGCNKGCQKSNYKSCLPRYKWSYLIGILFLFFFSLRITTLLVNTYISEPDGDTMSVSSGISNLRPNRRPSAALTLPATYPNTIGPPAHTLTFATPCSRTSTEQVDFFFISLLDKVYGYNRFAKL